MRCTAGGNASVFAHAAAQVKKALDLTHLLGGENFALWGGREGYQSLLNTDTKFELENWARRVALACLQKIATLQRVTVQKCKNLHVMMCIFIGSDCEGMILVGNRHPPGSSAWWLTTRRR